MKIVELRAENVKRLKAVAIKPDGSVVRITGKNGAGKCIPEGTAVALWSGDTKPIQDIRETDTVVGLDRQSWTFKPENPIALATSGVQQVFELRTKRGHSVVVTGNHRLLGVEGWTELEKLSIGDHVAVPMGLPCAGDGDAMSREEAELIGMLMGDGCLTEGSLTLASGDEGVTQAFLRCTKKLFPSSVVRRWRRGEGGWTLQVSKGSKKGRLRGEHLDWLHSVGLAGHGAYSKFLPCEVLSGGIDAIASCLAGLVSTDGWVGENGACEIYSRSHAIIAGARMMFLRTGIPTSQTTRQIQGRPFYRLAVVTARGRNQLCRLILPRVSRSSLSERLSVPRSSRGSQSYTVPCNIVDRLYEAGGRRAGSWVRQGRGMSQERFAVAMKSLPDAEAVELAKFASMDVGWDRIVSIENAGCVQTFDLQMPSEAFVANDFIVHNSSVLDAIQYAMGGKESICTEPVRRGEESATVFLDLGDLIVKRNFKADGSSNITVQARDGAKYPAPQAILDGLVGGRLAFDPLAFTRMPPKEQAETLRRLVNLDFTQQDAERRRIYDDRTALNRQIMRQAQAAADLPTYDNLPEAPPSSEQIATKIKEAQKQNEENNRSRSLVGSAQLELEQAERRLKAQQIELEQIGHEIEKLQLRYKAKQQEGETLEKQRAEADDILKLATVAAEALVDIDTAPYLADLAELSAINAKIEANRRSAAALEAVQALQTEADDLTSQIQAIDTAKAKAIAGAAFPIRGLGFSEDGQVTFGGLPFEQASSAEQLRVSVAMGLAGKPKLRVMLIRDGSLLDTDSMRLLEELAEANDAQIWCEIVADDEPVGIVIEDGAVRSARPEEAAAEAAAK